MELQRIQNALKERKIDGWLFCDFHNRDHLAIRILGLDPARDDHPPLVLFHPGEGRTEEAGAQRGEGEAGLHCRAARPSICRGSSCMHR